MTTVAAPAPAMHDARTLNPAGFATVTATVIRTPIDIAMRTERGVE